MRPWFLVVGALLSATATACTRAQDKESDLAYLVGKELPRPPPSPWAFGSDGLIEDRGPTTQPAAPALFGGTIWSAGNAGALLLSRNEGAGGQPRWVIQAVKQVQVPEGHFVTSLCELDGRADPELFAVVASETPCPEWYTRVFAAFRLNRSRRSIEPLSGRDIRCACPAYGMDSR